MVHPPLINLRPESTLELAVPEKVQLVEKLCEWASDKLLLLRVYNPIQRLSVTLPVELVA